MSKRGANRKPTTLAQLQRKAPIELSVWIPLDADAHDAIQRADETVANADLASSGVDEAKAARAQVIEDLGDDVAVVVFRALNAFHYKELVRAHAPSEEFSKQYEKENGVPAEFNPDTFAPALISACACEPKMTVDEVKGLVSDYGWSPTEYGMLYQGALTVNHQTRQISNPDF